MTSDEILSFLGYSTRVTYEDIKSIDRNILNKFIRETSDSYRIEVIFDAVLGHNDQITMMCVDRLPYLASRFYEEYVEKHFNCFKEIARKYPKHAVDVIVDFDDSLIERLADELFAGLLLKPILIHRLSDQFLLAHQEKAMKVVKKKPAMMRFLPAAILENYPEEVMALFRIDNTILKYMPEKIQLAHLEEIRRIVANRPEIYDYLCIKGRDKDLFYNVINKMYPTLTKEQRDLAYGYSLNNEYLFATLKPFMLDDKLVSVLGKKVIERLLRYKDIVNAIGTIYNDANKLTVFLEIMKLYSSTTYLESKIELICNALVNNEVTFIRDEQVEENFLMVMNPADKKYRDVAPMYITKHVSIGRLDDYIAEIVLKRPLTDIERKRVAYLYMKSNGNVFVDNREDFDRLDDYRLSTLQEKTSNPDLTISEAKDILFELKYGMSLTEVNNLLYKYGLELDDLLVELDKTNLSMLEVESKGALLNLYQMRMLSEVNNIAVLRDEIENAFVNYKGEESVYNTFLYLEDLLKRVYTTRLVEETNKDLHYSNVTYCLYEDVVPEGRRNPKYVGKRVRICKVDPESEYEILVSVNEGYRKNRDTLDEATAYEKWMSPKYNANHAICTSMIGNVCFGTAPITYADGTRKRIYRFKVSDGRAITASAPFDLASNSVTNTTTAMRSSVYLTGKKNIEYIRHTHSETVVEMDEVEGELFSKRTPSSMICFETVDIASLEAAIEFGIDIELIDRKQTAKFVRERIHNEFLKFEQYVLNNERQYKNCFAKVISDFSSMRAGFRLSDLKNIMVDELEALFNPDVTYQYFVKLFMDINTIVESGDYERVAEIIEVVRDALSLEEEKIGLLSNDGKRLNSLPYDKRYVMREIDKIERKCNLKKHTEVVTVQTLDNLDRNLSLANKHFNKRWSKCEDQFEYEDIKDKIDVNYIRNNIDSVYRNGLYTGFSSHDVSHIERSAVYASIIASLKGLPEDVVQMAITAAIYHDSGRISEGNEKHGDYSASIARSMIADSFDKEDVNIICAAIDMHDEEIEDEQAISKMMIKYRIKNRDRFTMVFKILKDADALDRARFLGVASLDPAYLRFDETRRLIKFATELNETEALRKIEELVNKHVVSPKEAYALLNSNKLPQEVIFELATKYKVPMTSPLFIASPFGFDPNRGLR